MYIDKWWDHYVGGTDDTCTLMDYFNKDDVTVYPLTKIFTDFNLYEQIACGSFKDTKNIRYFHKEGEERQSNIIMVIDLIMDLAAILLECLKNGALPLKALDTYAKKHKTIEIQPTSKEFSCITAVLKDFSVFYAEYDLASLCDEDDMKEIAFQCSEICTELEACNPTK